MSNSLIINARHQLQWHQRLVCDTSTALMWGGWLCLWRPFLAAAGTLGNLPAVAIKLLGGASPLTLVYSVVALAASSLTLLLWNLLPAKRAKETQQVRTLQDYAQHFQLSPAAIEQGRGASICVVHHDADGRIVGIEAKA